MKNHDYVHNIHDHVILLTHWLNEAVVFRITFTCTRVNVVSKKTKKRTLFYLFDVQQQCSSMHTQHSELKERQVQKVRKILSCEKSSSQSRYLSLIT